MEKESRTKVDVDLTDGRAVLRCKGLFLAEEKTETGDDERPVEYQIAQFHNSVIRRGFPVGVVPFDPRGRLETGLKLHKARYR